MNDDEAAQQADELALQRDAMEALLKAKALGLEETECMALAYIGGIANDFYKEIRK